MARTIAIGNQSVLFFGFTQEELLEALEEYGLSD